MGGVSKYSSGINYANEFKKKKKEHKIKSDLFFISFESLFVGFMLYCL
jgi:hypothetical protein